MSLGACLSPCIDHTRNRPHVQDVTQHEGCVTSGDTAKEGGFLVVGVLGTLNATSHYDGRVFSCTKCPVYRTSFLL